MSTAAVPSPPTASARWVFDHVSWDDYQGMLRIVGNRPHRVTFDRGCLEVRLPGSLHEHWKWFLGQGIELLALHTDRDVRSVGSTTLARRDLDRGLEADSGYYIGDLGRLAGLDRLDLTAFPPPDLALEIDITRSWLDRMGTYAALGVPEFWSFDGRVLTVFVRAADGSYRIAEVSRALPEVPLDALGVFLLGADSTGLADWKARVEAWMRAHVVPRNA